MLVTNEVEQKYGVIAVASGLLVAVGLLSLTGSWEEIVDEGKYGGTVAAAAASTAFTTTAITKDAVSTAFTASASSNASSKGKDASANINADDEVDSKEELTA